MVRQGRYAELKGLLSEDEYAAARSSTLNAHYTSPTVIRSIYDAVERMGFRSGNILEPSMGVGNFFGMLPDSMAGSRLYGVELDSITGRIAQKLYPQADITVAGFETTDRRDFYDLAVGNVPFGQYKVNDKAYNKLGFSMLKKIVLFPISLFVAFLALMARWLLTLSSYVVAPLMLYIFGCGIYTAYRQTWNQFFILLVAEFICFILFFGATAITEGIGRFSEWLAEL